MPPRSISSYFVKPATQAVASTSSASIQSVSITNVTPEKRPTSTPVTTTVKATASASTSSSPLPTTPKSKLSDAARKAIADALAEKSQTGSSEEPAAKKPKLTTSVGITANPTNKPIKVAKASSRSELRTSIASYPSALALLELEIDTMEEEWLLALQDELVKPYFLSLKEFIIAEQKTKKVFPPAEDIYSWSRFCPLDKVRVVIIGQDPYHDVGQAHGLAFSVRKGVRIPPSLRNIYKQMADDIDGFKIPTHGDLTEWAKHGVLLLNTSLTVRAHEAASHSKRGWEQFTAAVLKVVISRLAPKTGQEDIGGNGVVFMAWGAHAAKMIQGVDEKKHLILRSAHPSPLSASRGFLGNGHFKKSNEWLEKRYGPGGGIDWNSISAANGA